MTRGAGGTALGAVAAVDRERPGRARQFRGTTGRQTACGSTRRYEGQLDESVRAQVAERIAGLLAKPDGTTS